MQTVSIPPKAVPSWEGMADHDMGSWWWAGGRDSFTRVALAVFKNSVPPLWQGINLSCVQLFFFLALGPIFVLN